MKYELIRDEPIDFGAGLVLYRIRALVDIGSDVKAGDIGGFVESEENLSQIGSCWVYDDAEVFGGAYVCGNSRVSGSARVYGNNVLISHNAHVKDKAEVFGEAWVDGHSVIREYAVVCDRAEVHGHSEICCGAWINGDRVVFDSIIP